MSEQRHFTSMLGGTERLGVTTTNTTVSWKRYGDGSKYAEFWMAPRRCAVAVTVSETHFANKISDGKRDVTKQTMMTLDEQAVRKLHQMLGQMIEQFDAKQEG